MGRIRTCKGAQTAVAPGLLIFEILAAKVNVRTGNQREVYAHEEVTGRQVPEVQRVLHVAPRFVKVAPEEDQEIADHGYGGHYPNTTLGKMGTDNRNNRQLDPRTFVRMYMYMNSRPLGPWSLPLTDDQINQDD